MKFMSFEDTSLIGRKHTPAELIVELYREFDRLNSLYFDKRLVTPNIEISKRKSYGGYYQPARHRIVISWQAYDEHGLDETLNTFRHEVAHIVHYRHTRDFWELAAKLGVTERYAARPIKQPRTPHRYIYECISCRKRVYRNRRLRKASCGSCDKVYNPNYALKLVSD